MDFERILRYLAKLEENNNRVWFHENHDEYKGAKSDFEELTRAMTFTVAQHCEPLADAVLQVSAKDMTYRIPRDARVHKNAPPYNPAFRAYVAPNRKALWPLGYFVWIQPGDRSFISVGAFTNAREQLFSMREYIAARGYQLDEILMEGSLELIGDKLKKVPKGFDEDFAFAEYVKHKNWLVERRVKDKQLRDFAAFQRILAKEIGRMEPFRVFMNDALIAAGGENHW